MNVNDLELFITQKINASATDYELLLYTKAIQMLRSGGVYVIESAVALPDASLNEGQLYYIKNDYILAWSDGAVWRDIVVKNAASTQVWSWGCNSLGQIGDGTLVNKSSPVQEISSSTNWVQIEGSHGRLKNGIKADGTLWSWGQNTGTFGDGTTTDACSPVQEISSSLNWQRLSAGDVHVAAVKSNGTLWSWGSGACGRLGDGTIVDKSSPVQEISSSTNWCSVSAGRFDSISLKYDGTIWGWGGNLSGMLGDGTTTGKCSPVQEISASTNWRFLSVEFRNSATAIKTDGTLWAWGRGSCGRLGDGTTTDTCSPVQEISSSTNWCLAAAGSYHNTAIKNDGTLWAWGKSAYGMLGIGTVPAIGVCSPVQEVTSSTDWKQTSAGWSNSAAVKADGTLWSWGRNDSGQLGTNDIIDRSSPVQEIFSLTDWYKVNVSSFGTTSAIKIEL